MGLSQLAERLLTDLAADQRIGAVAPNADGIVPIEIGDVVLALAFSEGTGSVYVMSVIADRPESIPGWPWSVFGPGVALAPRRTRLAVEPESGALVLVTQVALAGLRYTAFADALDQFVADVRDTRGSLVPAGRLNG